MDGIEKQHDPPDHSANEIRQFHGSTAHQLIRVVGFFGGSKARESWTDVDIAVCTIEKVKLAVRCISPCETKPFRQMRLSIRQSRTAV